MAPSPVVDLNQAVAIAEAEGPAAGLLKIEELVEEGLLDSNHLLHSARAELLTRLGRNREAAASYRRALALTNTAAERRFLQRRLNQVGQGG